MRSARLGLRLALLGRATRLDLSLRVRGQELDQAAGDPPELGRGARLGEHALEHRAAVGADVEHVHLLAVDDVEVVGPPVLGDVLRERLVLLQLGGPALGAAALRGLERNARILLRLVAVLDRRAAEREREHARDLRDRAARTDALPPSSHRDSVPDGRVRISPTHRPAAAPA